MDVYNVAGAATHRQRAPVFVTASVSRTFSHVPSGGVGGAVAVLCSTSSSSASIFGAMMLRSTRCPLSSYYLLTTQL